MASNAPAIDLLTLEQQGLVTPNWRLAAGIALLTEIQRGRSSDTQSSSDTGTKRDRKRSISSDGSCKSKKKKGKKSKEGKGSDPHAGEEPPAAAFTPEPATPSSSTYVPTYTPHPPSKPNRPLRAYETAPKPSFKDSATDTTDCACMTTTLVTRGTQSGPTMVSTGTDPDARHPAFDSLPSDQEMDEVAEILDQRWEVLQTMENELGTQDETYIQARDSYSTSHQLYELVLLRLTAKRTRLLADLEVARSEQALRHRQETENSLVLATAARRAAAAASAPPSPAERLKRQAAASTVQVVLGSKETQAAEAALQAEKEPSSTGPQDPPRTPTKSPRMSPEPPLTPRGRRAVAKLADREASRPATESQTQPSSSRSGAARTDERHSSGTSHSSSTDRDRSRDRSSRRKKDKNGKDKGKSKKSSR